MRSLPALCLAVLLAFVPQRAVSAVCITDDGGDRICLDAPAQRIVPLYAAFTDILTDMGLADRVAGRTKTDTGPENATPGIIPSIGTHMRPNLELILGLKPHLALQMGGRAEAAESVAALRRHGVPTAFFRVRSFADLFSVIERVGILTGEEDRAASLVLALQARLAGLEKAVSRASGGSGTGLGLPPSQPGKPQPSVFFEVRYPNLLGAGPDSIVTDIIRAAGGRNALAGADAPRAGRVVRLSEEELLRLDPDVYCVQTGPMNKNPFSPEKRPHFAGLRAVRSNNVFFVDEHVFSRPGPRAVDAAEQLVRILHPALFPSQETPLP